MELAEYKSPPLSPWQRGQAFVHERADGRHTRVIRGHFVDGAPGSSYTMVGSVDNLHAVRVFVRPGVEPKQAAKMLRAMAAELEGVTLER